jgi:LysR family glycine cleavage system transcriptional activator
MTAPLIPSLQALRVLDTACRLKSFSTAAAELGLTHGAISHQVRALEAGIGAKLFVRSGRRMEPTERALAIVAQTRDALRTIGDAFARPQRRKRPAKLRISVTPSFSRFWLVPRLTSRARLSRFIDTLETDIGLAEFAAKQLDAAVRYGAGGWPNLQSAVLGEERSFPVCSPKLARRLGRIDADGVSRAPLIANTFISWRAWFKAAGCAMPTRLEYVLQVNESGAALDAAAAGLGVALARGRLARRLLASRTLVRLTQVEIDDGYKYHFVWPVDAKLVEEHEALREALASEFDKETRALGWMRDLTPTVRSRTAGPDD